MQQASLTTRFAPAERASARHVKATYDRLATAVVPVRALFDALPHMMVLLNEHRQIVLFNQAFLELLRMTEDTFPWGHRLGEVLGCVNAHTEVGGCGTAEACRECGMIHAVLGALGGARSVQECRVLTKNGGGFAALDLRTVAVPLVLEAERFTIVSLYDISAEKRRSVLERIFLHDVANLVGVIVGFAQLLPVQGQDAARRSAQAVLRAARRLKLEFQAHNDLIAAECGDLEVRPAKADSLIVLRDIVDIYSSHELAEGRELEIDPNAAQASMFTDVVLLGRVLGNMVKNAFEATERGGAVRLSCAVAGNMVRFQVNNSAEMPRSVQHQVFQRSFSTKDTNRGLGTYSMKLLTESYLGGTVWFTSNPGSGTTFFAEVPLTTDSRK